MPLGGPGRAAGAGGVHGPRVRAELRAAAPAAGRLHVRPCAQARPWAQLVDRDLLTPQQRLLLDASMRAPAHRRVAVRQTVTC